MTTCKVYRLSYGSESFVVSSLCIYAHERAMKIEKNDCTSIWMEAALEGELELKLKLELELKLGLELERKSDGQTTSFRLVAVS